MMAALRCERAIGLVPAIMVMSVVMLLGLGTLALADGQTRASRVEREGESTFNLTEGALNAQAVVLSRNWPGVASNAYSDCARQAGTAAANPSSCPGPAEMQSNFGSADTDASADWTTRVRDDGGATCSATGSSFYQAATVNAAPAWDCNGNKRLWVRADAEARGRNRSVVALVQVEEVGEVLPQRVVIAGHFGTSNSGAKVIVDPGTTAHSVTVRCTPSSSSIPNSCLDYAKPIQVNPPGAVATGAYVDQPALDAEVVARLERRARDDGTYFAAGTCPASLTGKVVFVENANCSYSGATYNSAASPGMVIFRRGTLQFTSNFTFYGPVYMMNEQRSSGDVFRIHANGTLRGGVFVDHDGGVRAGSDKFNIVYDSAAMSSVASYGTAGVVQNSWREIPPGS